MEVVLNWLVKSMVPKTEMLETHANRIRFATYFCPRCYISGDKMCRRRLFGVRLARFSSGSHHKVTIVTVTPFSYIVMTSSLRNSLHRRNHKERSQLAHRSKLGILEKHKDYVQRARDYHSKQDRLNRLRQKAAERNEDEFYFSMVKEKTSVRQTS